MRRIALAVLAIVLVGAAAGSYYFFFREPPPLAPTPEFKDPGDRLPTQDEFEAIAKSDPVKLLEKCLTRYQREVKGGITATLNKRERVNGEPKPPKEPREEVVKLSVRGDVRGTEAKTKPNVRMIWLAGARSVLGSEVSGTLYVEEQGGNKDQIVTWRPKALLKKEVTVGVNDDSAKGASRYCIKDSGLYGAMLRSHTVWKRRQDDGKLNWRYVEKRVVAEVGDRECFVVERTCPSPEVDPFEIGGEPNFGGKKAEDVGSVRIRLFIDAERWLQVGSELYRQDGHLLASYYFRDINLNPTFADDTFTIDGLKKAVAELKK